MDKRPIGVFDSGLGGLTAWRRKAGVRHKPASAIGAEADFIDKIEAFKAIFAVVEHDDFLPR